MVKISTERLIMRDWRESDLAPWAAMNADPEVRRYLGPLLTSDQAEAWVLDFQDHLDRYGFGFWALEVRGVGRVHRLHRAGHLWTRRCRSPGLEIAWRLARPAWGHGYATEAALAAAEYGFDAMGLPEIVAVTMEKNLRSQAVMRRIGMTTRSRRGLRRSGRGRGPATPARGVPETKGPGKLTGVVLPVRWA